MRMKLICIFINLIFIISIISGLAYAIDNDKVEIWKNNDDISLKIIEETSDKNLIYNDKIGNIYVQYWIHVINGVQIKGDYILLHKNVNNDIEKYLKIWTDVDFNITYFDENEINNNEILWKKLICFPDE